MNLVSEVIITSRVLFSYLVWKFDQSKLLLSLETLTCVTVSIYTAPLETLIMEQLDV